MNRAFKGLAGLHFLRQGPASFPNCAVWQFLVRLEENSVVFADNPNRDDTYCTDRRNGIGERGFALGELKPEIVDVLGAGLDPPRSEGVGRETMLEPIGERLRGWELGDGFRIRGWDHGGGFEKATRVLREREGGDLRKEGLGFRGRREEEEEGESSEEQIRQRCGFGQVLTEVAVAVADRRLLRWLRRRGRRGRWRHITGCRYGAAEEEVAAALGVWRWVVWCGLKSPWWEWGRKRRNMNMWLWIEGWKKRWVSSTFYTSGLDWILTPGFDFALGIQFQIFLYVIWFVIFLIFSPFSLLGILAHKKGWVFNMGGELIWSKHLADSILGWAKFRLGSSFWTWA